MFISQEDNAFLLIAFFASCAALALLLIIRKTRQHDSFRHSHHEKSQQIDSLLQEWIKKIEPLKPDYIYNEEKGAVNPAYNNISEHFNGPMRQNEKLIFVLRSDFRVITGTKKTHKDVGHNPWLVFTKEVQENIKKYLDPENRYGHPTLALPEGDYDGSVYYAGFVSQRDGYLQIFLSSGRFQQFLSDKNRKAIESYMAKKFIDAYGEQNVRFYDFDEDKTANEFFYDEKPTQPYREYNSVLIEHFARTLGNQLLSSGTFFNQVPNPIFTLIDRVFDVNSRY